MKPLAIDLFCGLGGWTEGLLAEGYHVVGFDIERHEYGEHRYPGHLLLYDVTELHGSWFKDAALIVASPPCQEYSYMAMPWKLGKAKAAAIRADITGAALAKLNRLFEACFRIQREASEAAGRHIPMVVENVRGAQPWVGKSVGRYGSFHLWGDVPVLPIAPKHAKVLGQDWNQFKLTGKVSPHWRMEGTKQRGSGREWFAGAHTISGTISSSSPIRKMASAMIAKIPLPLSRHIAAAFKPRARSSLPATFSPYPPPASAAPAGDRDFDGAAGSRPPSPGS